MLWALVNYKLCTSLRVAAILARDSCSVIPMLQVCLVIIVFHLRSTIPDLAR
jgi:hypothetical protein